MLSPTVSNGFNVTSVNGIGVPSMVIVGVNKPAAPPVFLQVTFTVTVQLPALQGSTLLSIVIITASICGGATTVTDLQFGGVVSTMGGNVASYVIVIPELDMLVIDISLVVLLHSNEPGVVFLIMS